MRGYTRFTQEHGDEGASALAARFAHLVREVVPGFGGELLELRGDEALCLFRSARQALRAAVEVQRRLRMPRAGVAGFPLAVGMGLDAGEAVPTEGGYRGRALNFAARLCAAAGRGEVLCSEGLAHLAHPVEGVQFGPPRQLRLKGVTHAVRVVSVEPERPLPPVPPPLPARTRESRRPVWSRRRGAIGVGVLVAAAVAILGIASRSGHAHHVQLGGGVRVRVNTVAVLDPATGRVLHDINVDANPWDIAAGLGAVWVADTGSDTITRIDPRTLHVSTIGLGGSPTAIATGDGSVWAFDANTGRIYQVDRHGAVTGQYHIPACSRNATVGGPSCVRGRIAAGGGQVWVGDGADHVYAMNVSTGDFTRVPGEVPARAILFAGNAVFCTDAANLARINPTTNTVVQGSKQFVLSAGTHPTLGIANRVSDEWLASPDTGTVVEVDRRAFTPIHQRTLTPGLNGIAAGTQWVWVTNEGSGTLIQINRATAAVRHTYPLGHAPTAVIVFADKVWVTIQSPNTANNQL
jgi:streptogramin lyase